MAAVTSQDDLPGRRVVFSPQMLPRNARGILNQGTPESIIGSERWPDQLPIHVCVRVCI